MEKVIMFVDGSCSPNPGKGGIGVVLIYNNMRKEFSEGYRYTTNSRMEVQAVIRGLQMMNKKGLTIEIYSDSKYVVDSVEKKWVFNWQKNSFKNRPNADLWKKLLELYGDYNIKFTWVKGHASNVENNRCDVLAQSANGIEIDVEYERICNNN